MNKPISVQSAASPVLIKTDPSSPALLVTGSSSIAIKAGTTFAGIFFSGDTPVPGIDLIPGADYVVTAADGSFALNRTRGMPQGDDILGGFHFAPGGNAVARAGGDDVPAINPCSVWDRNFRPACPDPRGMTLIDAPSGKFWCDIYLTGADHLDCTSLFGVTIADGDSPPQKPDGGRYGRFNYETAVAVMKHHGKGLLGVEEFFAAAFGVTEKTASRKDPRITGLDVARTSRFGLMQATGNLWAWGHDGDPDEPRASVFGGSWVSDGRAGSRYAGVADSWPGDSYDALGARGRSDHLQLV